MENIIRYVNGHRDVQLAAIAASEAGIGMLEDIQKKLRFAGNELQRMENEGGPSLNDKQAAKLDSYFKASRRIEKALLLVRHTASPTPTFVFNDNAPDYFQKH